MTYVHPFSHSLRPMAKYRENGYGCVQFSTSIPPRVFEGAKHIQPKHFQFPNCPMGPTLQKYRFILRAPWHSIEETAMAGSNFRILYLPRVFWVCQTHKGKAFSASQLPYRPPTAKQQVYSPRPMAKYRGNGYGWVQFSRSKPPRVFRGAKHMRPKHFQFPN